MAESNIHDVTLESGIRPHPYKPWKDYLDRVKEQARKLGMMPRNLMMKQGYGPTMDELPTHFYKVEGKHKSELYEWPRAGQDLQAICNSDDSCGLFLSRGYLCKRHNPSTSDLEVISHTKMERKITEEDMDKVIAYRNR